MGLSIGNGVRNKCIQGLVLVSLVQTKVVLSGCFTPGLNQVKWFGSKSCNHRWIVIHAGSHCKVWEINMASDHKVQTSQVIWFEPRSFWRAGSG